MVWSHKVVNIAAGICLAAISEMVHADDTAMNIELPTAASFYTHDPGLLKSRSFDPQSFDSGYLLAANEGNPMQGPAGETAAVPAAEFHPPWISGRKVHQYLGLSTVAFAGLTMLAAPDQEEGASQTQPRQTSGTTHTRLARATAALAVATVITGLIYHWDDIHWEDPFTDPDKMHARLAAAGALMMLYAVEKSAHSTVPTSHSGIAELGAATMLVAIKLTW
jgi:hypothetical protein